MSSKKSIIEKIGNIDLRVVYLSLLALMGIFALHPIGMPVIIGEEALTAYNFIERLPEGAVVGFIPTLDAMAWMQGGPPAIILGKHLFNRPLKIIIFVVTPDAPALTLKILREINPEARGKEYGRDYVFLGYAAGLEAAVMASAEDLWEAYGNKDFYGTPLKDIPVMKYAKNAKDFALLVIPASGYADYYVKYWYMPYKVPIITSQPPMTATEYMVYKKAGQIIAVMSGLRSGAEYELLVGEPGLCLAAMDQASAATLLLLGLIIMGNMSYFGMIIIKRRR
jgi:hypothetical protein